MDINLNNVQHEPIVVSASLTAANNRYYVNVASSTYTDPTPVEGEGFIVFVRNGTATVGGIAFSSAGTLVNRIYHSGSWSNYSIFDPSTTYTNGSILFAATNGIAQDNSRLYYDSSSNRLGIGTNSPSSFLVATGVQPASVATTNGTTAQITGAISLTGAQGGSTTSTTSASTGTGGNINISTGAAGISTTATTSYSVGGSGDLTLKSGNSSAASLSTSANNTGGLTGSITIQSPNGGAASSAAGNNTGGRSGNISILIGSGGSAGLATVGSGGTSANGGLGGSLMLTAGAGGLARKASASSLGGEGGNITLTAGNGGNATDAISNLGGNAGSVTIIAGTGGTGSTLNGSDGSITLATAFGNVIEIVGTGESFIYGDLISGNLFVNGLLQYTGSTPTSGYVLTSDASGNATWAAPSGGGGITIGTTTVTSGTTTRILYNNAGVVGEYTITGTGTVVAMGTSPTFTTDITTPKIIGGTGISSKITYVGTTNAGPTSTAITHEFLGGNSGATTLMTIANNGRTRIIGTVPSGGGVLTVQRSASSTVFGKPYISVGIDDYASNNLQTIAFGYRAADTSNSPAEFGFIQSGVSGQGTGDFIWALRAAGSVGSDAIPVEIMKLTYGGNLGIGVTAPTAFLSIAAGTTAKAQINFASSTAPTTPNNGDVWFDGTNLKIRVSGTTYTLTKV